MNRLVVAMHGDYNGIGLNDIGRQQMIDLGNKIKNTIKKDVRILILTATSDLSQESGEILSEILGATLERYKVLWFNCEQNPAILPEILDLVRSKKDNADIIILVTYRENSKEFPSYFGKNELKVGYFPMIEIGTGKGYDIDCKEKTFLYIR